MSTELPIVKKICEVSTVSEFPYRVQSYQFKALDDARRFSGELAAIPRSSHKHSVKMAHRSLMQISTQGETVTLREHILLDVTTTEPEMAEKEYSS
jgi:hypothetical protein